MYLCCFGKQLLAVLGSEGKSLEKLSIIIELYGESCLRSYEDTLPQGISDVVSHLQLQY